MVEVWKNTFLFAVRTDETALPIMV
jgi:hypothetical protein